MNVEQVVHEVTEAITREASVKAVFGDPIKLDDRTIVPIAVTRVAFGGGGGGGGGGSTLEKASETLQKAFGGGGGLAVVTVPIGFLQEVDGKVEYTALDTTEAGHDRLHKLLGRLQRVS